MAIERTVFDTWLKHNLWRDLIFRMVLGALFAVGSSYFALKISGTDAVEAFLSQTKTLVWLGNKIGTLTLFISLVALFLKDLELRLPKVWGQEAFLGRCGGVVRRLAGDLTLWLFNVILTVILAAAVLLWHASNGSFIGWATALGGFALLVASLVGTALLNIAVRTEGTFSSKWPEKLYIRVMIFLVVIFAFPFFVLH